MLFGSKVNRLAASGKRALSKYAVGTAEPELAFDFIDNKYVTSNSTTPISSAVTHSRAGNATMTDGYGPELVTNGTFASDSDWTKGTGWSIADGKSSRTNTGATSGLSQTITLTADVVYEVSYFLQIDSGNIATQFIGGTNVAATAHTTSGYKTDYIKANTGNTQIRLWASTTFEGSIDNVSVREMPVIKWAPHNLLTYSEQFDNAAWLRTDCTIDPNATTAPDGTATADELDFVGTNDLCRQISAHVPKVGETYTIACWLKAGTASSIDLVILFSGGGLGSTTKVCSLTNEWQLFTVSKTVPSGTPDNVRIRLQSNGAGTVYAWGAHAYRSDLGGMVDNPDRGDSYVPTTSAAAYLPRVGHHVYNGDAWVNEGVLAESESRTNIITGNDDLDNATYWNLGGNLTAAKDSGVAAPDGNSAWKLTNGTVGNFYFTSTVGSITPSAGNYITLSCYLKKGSAQYALLGFGGSTHSACVFDLNSNTITDTSSNGMGTPTLTTTVESVGNGWFRVGFTHLQDTGSPGKGMSVYPWITSTVPASLDGHGKTGASETLYVAFPQAEYYATPSSTIPTSGSSVTRAAETFTIPSANLPWSSTAVSIAMDGRMTYADDGDTGSSRFYQIQDGQHYLRAYLDTSSTKTGLVRFEQKDGTTYDSVDSSGTLYSPDILVPFNIASRHGSTFINGAIDGVALTANTTPTALPDLSATDLDLAYDYMGTIGTFRVWKRDLGDTGIVEATNPSLEPSLSLTFEGTGEGSFVVRDWSE